MSAIERADRDLERGDYGMARERLASYLNSKGYDPAMLERLGQLCYEMRDLAQAGRYWLASSAEGEHVEQAVAAFVRRSGTERAFIAAQLPRAVLETTPDSLPPVALERVRRLGLEALIGKPARGRGSCETTRGDLVCVTIGVLVAALVGLAFVVGLGTIVRWLFG